MKKSIYSMQTFLVWLLVMCCILSCQNDLTDITEMGDEQSCRLIWEGEVLGYDESRAYLRDNKDGDCVYLRFKTAGGYVDGKAIYSSSSDEWFLNCDGNIPTGTTSSCVAYYIDKVVENVSQTVDLNHLVLVCCDMDAEYSKGNGYIKLTALLTPSMGRIRFKGTEGQCFLLSGIKYITGFNTKSLEPIISQSPLQLSVGSDGYTEPVHALPLDDRTLTIYYDYQTYQTSCNSPILDAGCAGYMLLPTEESHNGWSLVKVKQAELSAVTTIIISDVIAEVSAEVSSLGNGTLLDAGFVYAESSNPTVDNDKRSCGVLRSLTATLRELKPETEYYVRAYATNERGTAYGPELKFKTTVLPTIPNVHTGQVANMQSDRVDVGGTIVNLGESDHVIQHGHVWSSTPNPTIDDNKTELGTALTTGDYVSTLTELQPNTTYYVRAYATNAVGTSYGDQQIFTTPYGNIAFTLYATSVKYNEATINTTITDLGGHTISERGICWSATGTPSISGNCIVSFETSNTYALTITSLDPETTYYVRAYAKIENGLPHYSDIFTITTPTKDKSFDLEGFGEDEDWNL